MDLLILQHPKETRHPLNSARIAQLGIRNCEILVGEDFTENDRLQNLLLHYCERLATMKATMKRRINNAWTLSKK